MRPAIFASLACAALLGAGTANAHLMPAQQGTVNVVGDGVFTVLSVPASALHGADDDHDGIIDMAELTRHEAELRAEIDRRLVILDGEVPAETVRVDLMLSPQHDAAGDREGQIVALKHARLAATPSDLRVRCDLFGARETERSLRITATRHPGGGTETEVAVLTPAESEHGFFTPAPAAPPRGPRTLLALGALCALALAGRSRTRRGPDL